MSGFARSGPLPLRGSMPESPLWNRSHHGGPICVIKPSESSKRNRGLRQSSTPSSLQTSIIVQDGMNLRSPITPPLSACRFCIHNPTYHTEAGCLRCTCKTPKSRIVSDTATATGTQSQSRQKPAESLVTAASKPGSAGAPTKTNPGAIGGNMLGMDPGNC